MSNSTSYYIGLMSGTSVDSIDAAIVDFAQSNIGVVATISLPIESQIKQEVLSLALPSNNEIARMRVVDQYFGEHFAKAALHVCKQAGIPTNTIKAIGSHGQTIRHYPKDNDHLGYSLQIGDPNIIAQQTGITTITDFRRRDIAAGGHGAPLAPAFHQAAFSDQKKPRIIVNLGGIANISYMPISGELIGFDSGPANMLLDSWCQKHLQTAYDKDGQWAKSGEVSEHLLSILLEHMYFSAPFPKSTGREMFNLQWLEECLARLNSSIQNEDVQATLLQLTVQSISKAIEQIDTKKESEVYICGGGAKNPELLSQLNKIVYPRALATTTTLGIDAEWVECAAFAWLAKQTLEHQNGNSPSVTGADMPVILGGIYWGS